MLVQMAKGTGKLLVDKSILDGRIVCINMFFFKYILVFLNKFQIQNKSKSISDINEAQNVGSLQYAMCNDVTVR